MRQPRATALQGPVPPLCGACREVRGTGVRPARAGRRPIRRGLLFLLALLALGVLQAQAQPTPTPPRSLSVVMDHDYPPYVFRDDKGVAQGILVDSWRLWEKGTGVPVTIVAMDWNAAQDLMRRGKADVIDTLFETEERRKDYTFSPATATIDVPVFVHKDLGGIRDAASLRGFPVGVKRGDASVERLTAQGVGPLVIFRRLRGRDPGGRRRQDQGLLRG